MTFNERLFTKPRLIEIVSLTDSISESCEAIAEALADYENADEEPASERRELRSEARDAAWSAINELLAYADDLRVKRDSLYDGDLSGATHG